MLYVRAALLIPIKDEWYIFAGQLFVAYIETPKNLNLSDVKQSPLPLPRPAHRLSLLLPRAHPP